MLPCHCMKIMIIIIIIYCIFIVPSRGPKNALHIRRQTNWTELYWITGALQQQYGKRRRKSAKIWTKYDKGYFIIGCLLHYRVILWISISFVYLFIILFFFLYLLIFYFIFFFLSVFFSHWSDLYAYIYELYKAGSCLIDSLFRIDNIVIMPLMSILWIRQEGRNLDGGKRCTGWDGVYLLSVNISVILFALYPPPPHQKNVDLHFFRFIYSMTLYSLALCKTPFFM